MLVQQLRLSIIASLEQYFPSVPVFVDGETPQGPFFQPKLVSATYERQREGRTVANYRFGIRFTGGTPLEAEELVDQLQEALELIEGDGSLYRGNKQIWVAGEEGKDPLFTVEYTLHLQRGKSSETVMMMEQMIGGERLK